MHVYIYDFFWYRIELVLLRGRSRGHHLVLQYLCVPRLLQATKMT